MQRQVRGLGLKYVALRKPLISEANQKKKGFRFLGNITFTLFQSDWLIRERREVDDMMLPACLVLNEQACGSSVMI